jgi:hypothetical protein
MVRKTFDIVSFRQQDIPDWNCPTCILGLLISNKIVKQECKESKAGKLLDIYDGFSQYGYFFMHLECNNPSCNENVFCLGFYYNDLCPTVNGEITETVYIPKYFYPNLRILNISNKCPQDIRNLIDISFSLYYSDSSSCANKIRVVLEHIMNNLRIKKETINSKGRIVKIKLHDRILQMKNNKRYGKISDYILAIKWIGNDGSHDDTIVQNDILDAYEILERVIEEIYEKKTETLEKKVKKINTKRKPLSKI